MAMFDGSIRKNKDVIYRVLPVYIPFWEKGTKRKLKCVACGDTIKFDGITRPIHFQLCVKCREPVWALMRRPKG